MNKNNSKTREKSAHCLCGAVKITTTTPNNKVGACHCGMCRRWSSGPFMEVDCGTDISIEGEEYVTLFDSSPWAERGFCSKCGSNLFYRLKGTGEHQVAAGLFENDEDFVLDLQVFIDRKPSFYNLAEKTKKMTEAEIFEKYGSPE